MYEITVPFVPTAPGFKKEEALEAAKKIGAKRVLLAGYHALIMWLITHVSRD